jgi:hypothetical protein
MERDETIERLKSCMVMESVCSSVYHLLSLNFPEEKELWNKLAMDEENHAEMIATVMEFKETEDITDYPIPEDLGYVRKTVEFADETRMLLINDKLSLRDALERLRNIHEFKNKGYVHDLLPKETDERIKKVYQGLFDIDESNGELVQSFLARSGVL